MTANNKAKIIATLGPASWSLKVVEKMALNGATGFRINFSHGNIQEWDMMVDNILETEKKTCSPLAIIGDLQGPNLRIGSISGSIVVKDGDTVKLVKAREAGGDEKSIPVPLQEFFEAVDKDDIILVDDGLIVLKAIGVSGDEVKTLVLHGGEVSSHKKISIKEKDIVLPLLSEKDKSDLSYAVKRGYSHIMVSFTESRKHVELIKKQVESIGGERPVILAKIETRRGVDNIEEILEVADGIVVARGDLGTHFPLEKIPVIQRMLIEKAREAGKQVVVATQLLSSMISNPVPTRSEVVDVYNAVLEGSDALLLTNETAVGKHPVEAVSWLRKILVEAERSIPAPAITPMINDPPHRFARGIVELAESIEAKVMVFSKTGKTAKRISKYRPSRELLVGVPSWKVARKLSIEWGTIIEVVEAEEYEDGLRKTEEIFKTKKIIIEGDTLVETYRWMETGVHTVRIKQVK